MTRLTKSVLIKLVKHDLEERGYLELKDSLTGAQGLFGKVIRSNFFLTLGLTISNYYEERFTATYYLSKTTRWGSIWGDIPRESYQRIGHFLTSNERPFYLDKEYCVDNVRDAWWHIDDESVRKFMAAVELTEERLLNEGQIFYDIENSREVKILAEDAEHVMRLIHQMPKGSVFKYVPKNIVDGIPPVWFEAAELVLHARGEILNMNRVKLLAADSWRQHQLIHKIAA